MSHDNDAMIGLMIKKIFEDAEFKALLNQSLYQSQK